MPHILLGNTFFQSGSIQSAIAQYQDAIRIAPDSFVAHFNLGNAFLKTGRTGDAIAQYQMVVRLKPLTSPRSTKTRGAVPFSLTPYAVLYGRLSPRPLPLHPPPVSCLRVPGDFVTNPFCLPC